MSTTASSWAPRHGWSQRSTRIAVGCVALAVFVGILGWAVRHQHIDQILRDFRLLGFAVGWVIALHVIVIAGDGIAWRALLHRPMAVSLGDFIWARWVREATNMLLPVAQVGGEVVGARILALRGLSVDRAGGSVVLDKLAEALSQVPFTLIGLLLMLALRGDTKITEAVGLALFVAVASPAAFLLARRTVWFRLLERRVVAWICSGQRPMLQQLARVFRAVRAIYRPERFAAAIAWHLAAWIIGAGEVWLALAFMGHPISLASAVALESLGQAITGLGFMVPAALGVQEGAYMAVGVALGLPPETALAVSLVKRVRQVSLGVPALCTWQALELRHLLGAAINGKPETASAKLPSSSSNSYVRRLMRVALRPFAKTALTPNGITWLRIVTGFGACAACAVGVPIWNHAAAVLWLVSALLDRGDGEFARRTHRCTERGRRLDYWGDTILNGLIFFAIGINLRHHMSDDATVWIGMIAAIAIGIAGVLAEALELRLGHKTVRPGHGFDSDDILFVLVPILWLGYLMPLLVGAFVGGIVAAVYIWYRLAHLSASLSPQSRALP